MIGKRQLGGKAAAFPMYRLLLLALFFLGGVILGQVLALRVPAATGAELETYLSEFLKLEHLPVSGTVISTLVLYFRYPLLAFLLGFASIGVFLLPLTSLAFGFFLSFSVCCFTAAFGGEGILLALAVFGLRCVVTVPCFLLLAVPSFGAAVTLAGLSMGKGRRSAPVVYGRSWWLRLAAATLVLLAGVLVDLMVSPYLLRLSLGRLFT